MQTKKFSWNKSLARLALVASLGAMSVAQAQESAVVTSNGINNVATMPTPVVAEAYANGDRIPFEAGMVPPQAENGAAYCLKFIPGDNSTICKEVEISPATYYLEPIPAKYEWREIMIEIEPSYTDKRAGACYYDEEEIQVMVKESYTEYSICPPVWECVDQCITVLEPHSREAWECSKFTTVEERIMVKPPRREQVKSLNPDGTVCYTMVECPPEYITICRKVCDTNATANREDVPGQTINVPKMVIKTPAKVIEKVIPAEYKTVVRRIPKQNPCEDIPVPAKTICVKQMVKVEDEGVRRVDVPAKTVTVIQTDAKVGQLWWVKVSCGATTTCDAVRNIATKYGSMPCTVVMKD